MIRRAYDALPDESVSHNSAIAKRVFLRNGDVPNVTQFARARFAPGQVAPAHAHIDMAEIFVVDEGVATFVVDGESHTLARGECIALLPGERHELRNDSDAELVVTYFGIRG